MKTKINYITDNGNRLQVYFNIWPKSANNTPRGEYQALPANKCQKKKYRPQKLSDKNIKFQKIKKLIH